MQLLLDGLPAEVGAWCHRAFLEMLSANLRLVNGTELSVLAFACL